MKWVIVVIVFIVCAALVVELDRTLRASPDCVPDTVRNEVERVFMNEPGVYSVWFRGAPGQSVKIGTFRSHEWNGSRWVKLYADAPMDGPMWVTLRTVPARNDPKLCVDLIGIHVHDPRDVDGAGWERQVREGKSVRTERGTTHVIE